jgi:RND family efflux transporter MFP subunit
MKALKRTILLLAVVCLVIHRAEAQQSTEAYEYPGTVVAAREAEVAPRIDALLEKIDFTAGQSVKKGDLLFEFSSRSKELSLAVAKARQRFMQAQLRLAEARLKNAENLRERDVSSEMQLLEAQAQRDIATANIEEAGANVGLAEINLSYTKLFAPIDGVIGPPSVWEGAYITLEARAQSSLATIVQLDPIHVAGEVPFVTFLQRQGVFDGRTEATERTEFTLTLPNGETYAHTGRMVAGTGAFNPVTQAISITVEFANPDLLLRPGLRVTLRSAIPQN